MKPQTDTANRRTGASKAQPARLDDDQHADDEADEAATKVKHISQQEAQDIPADRDPDDPVRG